MSAPVEQRLWSRAVKTDSGCWEYSGTRSNNGYGRISVKCRTVGAHRLAYELTKGPIPDGMFVLHACDNPPCINPDHLSVGTHVDNMIDMRAKGRHCDSNAAKTHCPKGHPYEGRNIIPLVQNGRPARGCRACAYEGARIRQARPSACPICAKPMNTGSVGLHVKRVHKVSRDGVVSQALAKDDR